MRQITSMKGKHMKKAIISALFFGFLSVSAQAQTSGESELGSR